MLKITTKVRLVYPFLSRQIIHVFYHLSICPFKFLTGIQYSSKSVLFTDYLH